MPQPVPLVGRMEGGPNHIAGREIPFRDGSNEQTTPEIWWNELKPTLASIGPKDEGSPAVIYTHRFKFNRLHADVAGARILAVYRYENSTAAPIMIPRSAPPETVAPPEETSVPEPTNEAPREGVAGG